VKLDPVMVRLPGLTVDVATQLKILPWKEGGEEEDEKGSKEGKGRQRKAKESKGRQRKAKESKEP